MKQAVGCLLLLIGGALLASVKGSEAALSGKWYIGGLWCLGLPILLIGMLIMCSDAGKHDRPNPPNFLPPHR